MIPFRPRYVQSRPCSSASRPRHHSSDGILHGIAGAGRQGIALLALLAAASPLYAGTSVPDWVHAAAAQTLPALPPSATAVVLLEDETYTVAPDGRATIHVRNVIKILRPQGRRSAEPAVD